MVRALAAAACAAVLFAVGVKLRRRALRVVRCFLQWFGAAAPASVSDPTFGTIGVVYHMDAISESWETFLDGLGFHENTPVRGHMRQLFKRQDLHEQLLELFDALASGGDRLARTDFERFSCGICGHVHVLLKNNTKMELVPAAAQDQHWILEEFDKVFPASRPLSRDLFPGVATTVLLRRIVRTLMATVGLELLQRGLPAPLVVDISVDLGAGRVFRVHTVAPSGAPSTVCGERLSLIEESPYVTTEDSAESAAWNHLIPPEPQTTQGGWEQCESHTAVPDTISA